MEEITQIVVPEVPKVIPNEQLYVYIPIANGENPGIVIYDSDYFEITNGVLTIKHSSNSQIGVIRGSYPESITDYSKDILIDIVDGVIENVYLKQTVDNSTQYITILQVISSLDSKVNTNIERLDGRIDTVVGDVSQLTLKVNGFDERISNAELDASNAKTIANNSLTVANEKVGVIRLSSNSTTGTLTDDEYNNLVNKNYLLQYKDEVYLKRNENSSEIYCAQVFLNDSPTSGGVVYNYSYYIRVYKDSKNYSRLNRNYNTYTKTKIDELIQNVTIPIDSELSNSSTNPVQNKVVTNAINTNTTNIATNSGDIAAINLKIPSGASSSNKMTTRDEVVGSIDLSINSSTYVVTLQCKDVDGNNLGNAKTIDLPLESVVVSGSYDSTNKKVILTLQNGSTIEFSVADLVAGLQTEITSSNKLDSDLVDDTNQINKFVTSSEKTQIAKIGSSTLTTTATNLSDAVNELNSGKQSLIDSSHKLSADFIDDTNTTNKFVTAGDQNKINNAVQKTGDEDIYGVKFFSERPKLAINHLPSGYTRLTYLENTSNSYFDLGLAENQVYGFDFKFKYISLIDYNRRSYLTSRFTTTGATFGIYSKEYAIYLEVYIRSTRHRYTLSNVATEPNIINYKNGVLSVNNESTNIGTGSLGTNSYNICLFGADGGISGAMGRFYYLVLYNQNGEIIRNYVPAKRNSDNKVGIFDTVTGTFNVGIGTFNAGGTDDVDPSLYADFATVDDIPEDEIVYISSSTTYAEVTSLLEDNKLPILVDTNFYYYQYSDSTTHYFYQFSGANQISYKTLTSSGWTSESNTLQNQLTTSSVNDGTLDKTLGFDSQGNIVKGNATGGVTSIGGATGAITLGSGLTIVNNELSATGGGGGGGITNYQVISRQNSLPTATSTSPDFVQYNGELYQKRITTVPVGTITNLTDTTWVFNDNITSSGSSSLIKSINFTSNSNNYTRFEATSDARIIYNSTSAYSNSSWSNSAYKTIQITGGSDVTDTDLIDFLETNATLQSTTYLYEIVGGSSIANNHYYEEVNNGGV